MRASVNFVTLLIVLAAALVCFCSTAYSAEVRQPGIMPWEMALLSRHESRIRGIAIGSSTTEGANASPRIQRWSNRIEKMLQASYNPRGIGGGYSLRGLDSGHYTHTGNVGTASGGLGLRSRSLQAGATMKHTTLQNSTGFAIYFTQGPDSGNFQVTVDNYPAITIYPNKTGTSNRHDGEWHSPIYPRKVHTIVIKALSACKINTIYVYDNDNEIGVQFFNSGYSGGTISNFLKQNATQLYTRMAQLQPQFVSIMLGSNEYGAQKSIASFKNEYRSVINTILETVTQTPWIPLIGMPARMGASKAIPYSSYLQAVKEIAEEYPQCCTFHDLSPYFPISQPKDNAAYNLMDTDGLHPTTRGHHYQADLLAQMWQLPSRTVSERDAPIVTV